MRVSLLFLSLALLVAGCPSDPGPGDAGLADAGRIDTGPCDDDSDCPGSYCNFGSNACCEPADPPYEICGDMIDQNCDREDTGCGDTDRDMIAACRPGQDPTSGVCDCDDSRPDVRPPSGVIAGAPEACDGVDNDCNGRIDESSACCDACASLGADRDRADICTTDGVCDCSTDAASGPCPEGFTCCTSGCVDVTSDVLNCGFCNAPCTAQADRCTAGACMCGAEPPCAFTAACTDGACAM